MELWRRDRIYLVGFSAWKTFIRDWLPGKSVEFIPKRRPIARVIEFLRRRYDAGERFDVAVWSYADGRQLGDFLKERGLGLVRVEDGFIRSIGLGSRGQPPYSLCFDQTGLYFDATGPSDLETLIQEEAPDEALLARAQACMARLRQFQINKYNLSGDGPAALSQLPLGKRVVLVIGQVEDDASIRFGRCAVTTNAELLRIAAEENPDAQIVYKPHPEEHRGRPLASLLARFKPADGEIVALGKRTSLYEVFGRCDRAYTITSLGGFEALIAGTPVTCLGAPFYAGWGLTEDRAPCPRRTASRSLEQVFACAYIRYARYLDPRGKEPAQIEQILDFIEERIAAN